MSKRSLENSFTETIGANTSKTGSLEPVDDYQSIHIIAYSQQAATLTLQFQVAGQSFPSGLIESIVDLEPEQLLDFYVKARGPFFRIKYENLSSSSSLTKIETFYSNRIVLEADSDNVQIKALDEDGNLSDIRTDTSGNLNVNVLTEPQPEFIPDALDRTEFISCSTRTRGTQNQVFAWFNNNNTFKIKVKQIKMKILQRDGGDAGRNLVFGVRYLNPQDNNLFTTGDFERTAFPAKANLQNQLTQISDCTLSVDSDGDNKLPNYNNLFPVNANGQRYPTIKEFSYISPNTRGDYVPIEVTDTIEDAFIMEPLSALAFDIQITTGNTRTDTSIYISYETVEMPNSFLGPLI